MLAAISLPPLTDDANRHAPSRRHPGRPAAASNAAPIAASANRPASAGGRIASPPSSTASAANATPSSRPRARNRRTQPRAVVYGTPARAAAGRTPHAPPATCRDHRADRLGHIQPPGQHERRQQRVAHPARRAPHPGHEDLPAAAPPAPDMPPVAGPEHQRPGARRAVRAREPPPHGQPPHTHRPASGHGHTMATGDSPPRIPPRDRRQTRRGGIPHVQQRQENPGPHSGSQEATSSKSTARHAAEMLRKSSRQHLHTRRGNRLRGSPGPVHQRRAEDPGLGIPGRPSSRPPRSWGAPACTRWPAALADHPASPQPPHRP